MNEDPTYHSNQGNAWAGFIPLLGFLGAALTGLGAWFLLAAPAAALPSGDLVRWLGVAVGALNGLLLFGHPAGALGIVDYEPHPLKPRDLGVFLLKALLLAWLYLGLPWVTSWFTGGFAETLGSLERLAFSIDPWNLLLELGRIGTYAECLLFLVLLPVIYLGFNAFMAVLQAFEGRKPAPLKALALILGPPLTLGLGLGGLGALLIASFANFLGALGFLLILLGFTGATTGVWLIARGLFTHRRD